MAFRRPALFLLLLLISAAPMLHAQVGVYGLFDGSHLSRQASSGVPSASNWLYGPTFGVFYTPLHLGPVAAGLDLRGSFANGGSQHLREGQLGIRVSAKAPILPLRPYGQASVGVAGTRSDSTGSLPTHYTSKFAYGVLGGLDLTVLPLIDLRVVELGYNHVTGISSGTPATATNLFHLGAGIVLRLP